MDGSVRHHHRDNPTIIQSTRQFDARAIGADCERVTKKGFTMLYPSHPIITFAVTVRR
jgi:hypothetical protein